MLRRRVSQAECINEQIRDLRWNQTSNDPCPAVGLLANTVADKQGEEDAHHPRGHIHQRCFLWVIAQIPDQCGRVCRDDTTGHRELCGNVSFSGALVFLRLKTPVDLPKLLTIAKAKAEGHATLRESHSHETCGSGCQSGSR